jgi:uncharacterized protein YkwD
MVVAVSLWVLLPRPAAAEQPSSSDLLAQVLALTNAERQVAGLEPLVANPDLAQAAQSYANVLASGDCFNHTCGSQPALSDRINATGYTNWNALGENIAGGYVTPEQVVAGWMASPGHRANILNSHYTEIGLGYAVGGGQFSIYWTQEFGSQRRGQALNLQPAATDSPQDAPADDSAAPETAEEEPAQ